MNHKLNIVLTGFMGTGKTAVGRLVAERLGWPFLDTDDLIVQRAGKPISRIFAEDGEPAFRALEAAVCRELRLPASQVIATGGGMVADPANREALFAGGVLICLDASPETILSRIGDRGDRPMLAAADPLLRIRELLAQRAPAYAAIAHHLDTSELAIPAAAERVLALAAGLPEGGHRLIVRHGPPAAAHYDVLIARGLLGEAGRRLVEAGVQPGRCAVVTNPTVAAWHGNRLLTALRDGGFEPIMFALPDGEAYKTLETVAGLYASLAAAKLARGEAIISLGGGVIGDLAGFAAATWLRGVPFVQVPTSLLAMVDASVGGKVGVDLPQGKNLVGAFKQPALVLVDPELLETLPPAEFRSGMAEVLKAGLIADPALFERLASPDRADRPGTAGLTGTVADAVRIKARIVEADPLEDGERAWLNLGHTFGHALELVSGFALRHGEAVGLGLVAAAELSATAGYCSADLPGRIRAVLAGLELPVCCECDPDQVLAAMGADKKRRGRALRFVLIRRVGQVEVVEGIPEPAVRTALASIAC